MSITFQQAADAVRNAKFTKAQWRQLAEAAGAEAEGSDVTAAVEHLLSTKRFQKWLDDMDQLQEDVQVMLDGDGTEVDVTIHGSVSTGWEIVGDNELLDLFQKTECLEDVEFPFRASDPRCTVDSNGLGQDAAERIESAMNNVVEEACKDGLLEALPDLKEEPEKIMKRAVRLHEQFNAFDDSSDGALRKVCLRALINDEIVEELE